MIIAPIAPSAMVTFIGLGQMGGPMACRLLEAGFRVTGVDLSDHARRNFEAAGGLSRSTPAEGAAEADVVVTMLPNGSIVREALLGSSGATKTFARGGVIIDMSSSSPTDTTDLAAELAERGFSLIDAPVSGGVKRAIAGTLAIMAGGSAQVIEGVRPVLKAMGQAVFQTGPIGSGHAMKALNNYVSAAGLIAACEALIVGQKFGLDPDVIVDVLNASTGRNNSTEVKLKPFVIAEAFNSGFSLALMTKDLRIAADLATHLGLGVPQIHRVAELWEDAKVGLAAGADHTEIHRYLQAIEDIE